MRRRVQGSKHQDTMFRPKLLLFSDNGKLIKSIHLGRQHTPCPLQEGLMIHYCNLLKIKSNWDSLAYSDGNADPQFHLYAFGYYIPLTKPLPCLIKTGRS